MLRRSIPDSSYTFVLSRAFISGAWKMLVQFILLSILIGIQAEDYSGDKIDLSCSGRAHYNATLTAYYPVFDSDDESDYLDARGKKLRTLQDFIDGRAEYVTAAMDEAPKLQYGSSICIPELNEHFGKYINIEVRDRGINLKGKGYSRIDICVRTEEDSYDYAVNRLVTIYT